MTVIEGRRQNYFPFVGSELIQGERQLFCREGDWILTASDGSTLNLSHCSCSSRMMIQLVRERMEAAN